MSTPPEVLTALAYDLAPLLAPHEEGYCYVYQQAAGVVIWHAEATNERVSGLEDSPSRRNPFGRRKDAETQT